MPNIFLPPTFQLDPQTSHNQGVPGSSPGGTTRKSFDSSGLFLCPKVSKQTSHNQGGQVQVLVGPRMKSDVRCAKEPFGTWFLFILFYSRS